MQRLLIALGLALASSATLAEQICQPEFIPASAPTSRFVLQDGVAIDTQTGLMWRRCFEGKTGAACDQGQLTELSWPKALHHVQAVNRDGRYGGFSNWRLPNIKELASLGEFQCVQPALNLEVFPNAPGQRTWSASPYEFYPHYSWFVDFDDLTTDHLERFKPFALILVRDQ